MQFFMKNAPLLLVIATLALAGCSSVAPQTSSSLRVRRVEMRTMSTSDMASLQAIAAEANEAAAEANSN